MIYDTASRSRSITVPCRGWLVTFNPFQAYVARYYTYPPFIMIDRQIREKYKRQEIVRMKWKIWCQVRENAEKNDNFLTPWYNLRLRQLSGTLFFFFFLQTIRNNFAIDVGVKGVVRILEIYKLCEQLRNINFSGERDAAI